MTPDQVDADLRAAIDERMAARREAARRRREKAEQDRAAKQARRTAGLRNGERSGRRAHRHNHACARTRTRERRPDPMTDNTDPAPATVDEEGVPLRRRGRRCGWVGKERYDFGATRLRVALTRLARDPDPDARAAGVAISDEVADLLHRFATRADESTTAARRAREKAARLLHKANERLQQAQADRGRAR